MASPLESNGERSSFDAMFHALMNLWHQLMSTAPAQKRTQRQRMKSVAMGQQRTFMEEV
jgi:hypothetical protein